MAKVTMKARVLDFVESQGSASFTQIQEFIVDQNYGKGTYKAAAGTATVWRPNNKTTKANPYRGYYCAAFTSINSNPDVKRYGTYRLYKRPGYFLVGANRIVKGTDGRYTTVRDQA